MLYILPTNAEIAEKLDQIATLLEQQQANVYRVAAYRKAAKISYERTDSIADLVLSGGTDILEAIPGIGESLARQIVEVVKTGKSTLLYRLQGMVNPEDLFEKVPGIGKKMAERIVYHLKINSLEELEQAAHDGRLGTVEGFGKGRIDLIKVYLAGLLNSAARYRIIAAQPNGKKVIPNLPPIHVLLDIDWEYFDLWKRNKLQKVAPRRFNPEDEPWMPIYHTKKGDWEFTALFSNTARAHELKKTTDWVIIYYSNDQEEGQVTIVTETSGPLKGKRVIRGQETACQQFYEAQKGKLVAP